MTDTSEFISTHYAPSPSERKDNYLPYKGRSGDAI